LAGVLPERIQVDNGPEFIAQAMESWAESNGIVLKFIPKGKRIKTVMSSDLTGASGGCS